MAIKTMKQRRLDSAALEERTNNPCTRCIYAMANNGLERDDAGCRMLDEMDLRIGMSEENVEYTKCFRCLTSGEKCHELPKTFENDRVKLETVCKAATTTIPGANGAAAFVPGYKEQEKVRERASMIVESLKAAGKTPYDDHLFAHSGTKGRIGETGIVFEKRARSKADVARKEKKKRALEEADSEDDDVNQTPSKKRYGVKGVRKSKGELTRLNEAAESAARVAEIAAAHAKCRSIRGAPSARRTNAQRKWLTEFNRKVRDGGMPECE